MGSRSLCHNQVRYRQPGVSTIRLEGYFNCPRSKYVRKQRLKCEPVGPFCSEGRFCRSGSLERCYIVEESTFGAKNTADAILVQWRSAKSELVRIWSVLLSRLLPSSKAFAEAAGSIGFLAIEHILIVDGPLRNWQSDRHLCFLFLLGVKWLVDRCTSYSTTLFWHFIFECCGQRPAKINICYACL